MTPERAIIANYFFSIASFGATQPFLAPFFKETCGMSDPQIGLLFMVSPVVAFFSQPLWSYLADSTGRRSKVTAIVSIAAGITALPLFIARDFWPLVIFLGFWSFFNSSIVSLGDSVTFSYLGDEKRHRYSQMRLYGTAGFTVMSALAGPILDAWGMQAMFLLYAMVVAIAAWCISRVPTPLVCHVKIDLRHDLKKLLTNRKILVLLLIVVFGSLSNQIGFVFFGVYLKKLGATNAELGWVWSLGTITEIIVLFFMPRLMLRIGLKTLIMMGLLSIAARWFAVAHLIAWWQVLPFQLLHGITFAFFWVSSATYIDGECPTSLRSSAQALFAIVNNVASLFAGVAAGLLAQYRGYSGLYVICGMLAAGTCAAGLLLMKEPGKRAGIG